MQLRIFCPYRSRSPLRDDGREVVEAVASGQDGEAGEASLEEYSGLLARQF